MLDAARLRRRSTWASCPTCPKRSSARSRAAAAARTSSSPRAACRSARPTTCKQLLDKLGEVLFWKIAMKPGRPLAYGRIGGAHFFGLPGNPVVGDGDVLRVRAGRAARSCRGGATSRRCRRSRCRSRRRSARCPGAPNSSAASSRRTATAAGPCARPATRARASCRRCRRRTASSCCPPETGNVAAGELVDVQLLEGLI